jgi:hypothetical protein
MNQNRRIFTVRFPDGSQEGAARTYQKARRTAARNAQELHVPVTLMTMSGQEIEIVRPYSPRTIAAKTPTLAERFARFRKDDPLLPAIEALKYAREDAGSIRRNSQRASAHGRRKNRLVQRSSTKPAWRLERVLLPLLPSLASISTPRN